MLVITDEIENFTLKILSNNFIETSRPFLFFFFYIFSTRTSPNYVFFIYSLVFRKFQKNWQLYKVTITIEKFRLQKEAGGWQLRN